MQKKDYSLNLNKVISQRLLGKIRNYSKEKLAKPTHLISKYMAPDIEMVIGLSTAISTMMLTSLYYFSTIEKVLPSNIEATSAISFSIGMGLFEHARRRIKKYGNVSLVI